MLSIHHRQSAFPVDGSHIDIMIGKTRGQVTRVGLDILKNVDALVSRACSMAAPVLKKVRLLRFVEDTLRRCENDMPGDDHQEFREALVDTKAHLYPVLLEYDLQLLLMLELDSISQGVTGGIPSQLLKFFALTLLISRDSASQR